jgi:hypothetical protein
LTITDPSIKAGDTIYELTTAGLEAVGTATADGTATISFSNDPTFVVTAALESQLKLSITTLKGRVGAALVLKTKGGSGTGTVKYAVKNGSAGGCQISGNILRAKKPGTCIVTATKAADAAFNVATSSPTRVIMAPKR